MTQRNACGPRPALDPQEIEEITYRAARIKAEYPRLRGKWSVHIAGRFSHLTYLAEEYGITLRTLYRYMRRAA